MAGGSQDEGGSQDLPSSLLIPGAPPRVWGQYHRGSLFLLASLLCLSRPAPSAVTNPDAAWSLGIQVGHDDQILADPERVGILRPVSGYGWTGQTLLLLAWPERTVHDDALEIRGGAALTRYRNGTLEGDSDLDAQVSYRRPLSARWSGEASLSGSRFRREGVPFFDLDLIEGRLRASYSLGDRSFASIEAAGGLPSFRGRVLSADSTRTEADRQARLTAGFRTSIGTRLAVGIEGGLRSTKSNDLIIENSGPILIARGSARLSRRATAMIETAFTHRSYSAYPVLAQTINGLSPTGEWRRDNTWQLLAEAEGRVMDGWDVYAGGGWTRQTSNIAALEYDQSRFYLGLRFTPLRSGRSNHRIAMMGEPVDPPPRGPQSPLETPSGVVFRFHAPGAREVSLVGDFNGWDPARAALDGPDSAGDWRVTEALPPGLWRYAFVVDGVWTKPPDAERYEGDGFGGENGIILVARRPAGETGEEP